MVMVDSAGVIAVDLCCVLGDEVTIKDQLMHIK